MSLYISLRIGPSPVDTIRVSRITNTDEPILDPDTVSTYQVDRGIPYGDGPADATIQHRYGDGATELARKALNALAEQPECIWVDTTTYADTRSVQTCALHGDTRTYPRTETTP